MSDYAQCPACGTRWELPSGRSLDPGEHPGCFVCRGWLWRCLARHFEWAGGL